MNVKVIEVTANSDLSHLSDMELRACKAHYREYLPAYDAVDAVKVINKYMVRKHPIIGWDFDEDEIAKLPAAERKKLLAFKKKHEGKSLFKVTGELIEAGEITEDF